MTTPAILPPPLHHQNPLLLCRLIRTVNDTCGLDAADRLVLTGVLQHLPTSTSTSTTISRIATLSPDQLKLLADIFAAGLVNARSWGERRDTFTPGSTRSTATDTTPTPTTPVDILGPCQQHFADLAVGDLFSHLEIAPFPTAAAITNKDPAVPPQERSKKHIANCLARQEYVCPITTRTLTLETAHLIPYSVTRAATPDTAFWLLLAVVLGPHLRDTVYEIVHDTNSYSTTNGLALDSSLHKLFDKGTTLLLPNFTKDATFDPGTCRSYDIVFQWRDHVRDLKLWMTYLPKSPEEQTRVSTRGRFTRVQGEPRNIADGDVFRLWTNDPVGRPLPHPLLLSTHAMLWRMICAAGLGTSDARKKRRILGAGGIDEGDPDRHPRGKKQIKRRKKDAKSPSVQASPPPPSALEKQDASEAAPEHCSDGSNVNYSDDNSTHSPIAMALSVDAHFSPPTPVCSVSPSTPTKGTAVPKDGMTYMQKAYLDFRLLQLATEVGSESESGSETDGEYSDEEEEEGDSFTDDQEMEGRLWTGMYGYSAIQGS